jgi:hypothetical protein
MPVASLVCWALSVLALLAGAIRPESSRGPRWPAAGCPGQGHESAELSVVDFGATPNDGENDAPGLRAALEACRRRGPTTLVLPPGRYDLRDEEAVRLMDEVMSGAHGINPETAIFRPYFPYVRGLDFTGIEDLTVEAAGAQLICDGWMEPLSLESCRKVAIRGLTIDYLRPPHSIGTISNVTGTHFDVAFADRYPVQAGMPMPRVMLWDRDADRMLGPSVYPSGNELVRDQLLRIQGPCPREAQGHLALVAHSFHFRPAILLHRAEDVVLDRVTIHSQPGMGIVGHRSRNLTFTGLRVVPRAGSVMSTNTDATHFTSCSGFIHFLGCQFEGHGDDATNIHNYYYTLSSTDLEASYDLTVESPTGTHAQVLDHPEPGDTLELVEMETLGVVGTFDVASVEGFPDEWRSRVRLDRPIPGDPTRHYLVNASRLPSVRIEGCQVRSHRARAFLIKTRDVLIQDNTIENTTGTAIHMGAEGYWHEGPGSADVTIRNNRFLGCGRGEGTIEGASAIAVNVDAPRTDVAGVHRRILIEGNQVVGPDGERGIFVSGARDVTIRFNQIAGVRVPIEVQHSDDVAVYENDSAEAPRGPPR